MSKCPVWRYQQTRRDHGSGHRYLPRQNYFDDFRVRPTQGKGLIIMSYIACGLGARAVDSFRSRAARRPNSKPSRCTRADAPPADHAWPHALTMHRSFSLAANVSTFRTFSVSRLTVGYSSASCFSEKAASRCQRPGSCSPGAATILRGFAVGGCRTSFFLLFFDGKESNGPLSTRRALYSMVLAGTLSRSATCKRCRP